MSCCLPYTVFYSLFHFTAISCFINYLCQINWLNLKKSASFLSYLIPINDENYNRPSMKQAVESISTAISEGE